MFLQFFISMALAANIVVKAPSANPHEYFVHAQNSGDTKISTHLLTCTQTGALKDLFKEAQFHFLNSSLEKAQEKFSAVTDFKWGCDWQDDERKMIVFAFLRLAQINSENEQRDGFLTSAVQFDDSLPPDISIFPPPLVTSYKKIKSQLQKAKYTLPPFTKKYSYILRNGRFQSLNDFVFETYDMKARITLVSDAYRPETQILTPAEFSEESVEPVPFVQGDCNDFKLSEDLKSLPNLKVFFSTACTQDGSPQQLTAALHGSAGFPKMNEFPQLPDERKKTWIERNYLWLGAAVVGSLIIAHQISKNEEPQTMYVPSNTLSQ